MSYVAIIATSIQITDKMKDVSMRSAQGVGDLPIDIANEKYAYMVSEKDAFCAPWFPRYWKNLFPDKDIFINALKEVNEKYLLTKIYFYIMANGDPVKGIRKISMDELIDSILTNKIEQDVVYKVVHDYEAYRKVEVLTRAKQPWDEHNISKYIEHKKDDGSE